MDWVASGLLALAIGLPAVLVLGVLLAAWRLTRLRWRDIALGLAAPGSVPPPVRTALDGARPLLTALGFQFRYTTASEPALVSSTERLTFNDVYQHADKHAHAVVTAASAAGRPAACSIMWVTQLRSGHVLATVNCYLHKLLTIPAGWLMDDGYLPGAQQSWQRHLQRLPDNPQAIVTDGVEFFRANKQAVDSFIPQCEKRGLMQAGDAHWQLRWPAAVVFAFRQVLGQRRAIKAARRAARRPGSAVKAGVL